MYQRIVVPLDGSELAECVLPHVEALVKGCQVKEIFFIRVAEPFIAPANPEYPVNPAEISRVNAVNMAEAEDYVKKVAGRSKYEGVKVSGEVMAHSLVAASILEYCAKQQADLIVIATHGRSGVSRWVFGSVADRLLRGSCTPVLMVRAPGCVPGI